MWLDFSQDCSQYKGKQVQESLCKSSRQPGNCLETSASRAFNCACNRIESEVVVSLQLVNKFCKALYRKRQTDLMIVWSVTWGSWFGSGQTNGVEVTGAVIEGHSGGLKRFNRCHKRRAKLSEIGDKWNVDNHMTLQRTKQNIFWDSKRGLPFSAMS